MKGLQVPNHLAVILDGNRRWAKARGLPPWEGHKAGAKTFENFINWCLELGIPKISVYTLSTENLNRPKKELEEIFKILYEYVEKLSNEKFSLLEKYEVKVRFIGDLSRLPPKLVKTMGKLMAKTSKFQKKVLNFLVAYGGRYEILQAAKKLAEKMIKFGRVEITEKDFEESLYVQDPVDLIIRTGGYSRLSNLLLWQSSYAELIVLKKFWPDFTKRDLISCIKKYNKTQRNLGL